VREHSVDSLLAWGEARLRREADAEAETALAEVAKIVDLRLGGLVSEDGA
jgi:2-oxo-4-hydroxy-4-carboxy--5-ureidoimidazoline (OHCU) decarboxylase